MFRMTFILHPIDPIFYIAVLNVLSSVRPLVYMLQFSFSCPPIPSVPNFPPLLCLSPWFPTRCLSRSSLLFFKNYVRAQSRRLRAFPHKQPNLSLWFSACLFWVFLRDDISAGKPNSPERVLSLWGSSRLRVKIGRSFSGYGIKDWWAPPEGPALAKRDHHSFSLCLFVCVCVGALFLYPFQSAEHVKTTIWVVFKTQ